MQSCLKSCTKTDLGNILIAFVHTHSPATTTGLHRFGASQGSGCLKLVSRHASSSYKAYRSLYEAAQVSRLAVNEKSPLLGHIQGLERERHAYTRKNVLPIAQSTARDTQGSLEDSQTRRPSRVALQIWQSTRAVLFHAACIIRSTHGNTFEPQDSAAEQSQSREKRPITSSPEIRSNADNAIQQGFVHLVHALKMQGSSVYVYNSSQTISSSLAQSLELPSDNIFTGSATMHTKEGQLGEATSNEGISVSHALQAIREKHPYDRVTMVGSTLEHIQAAEGADLTVAIHPSTSLKDAQAQYGADWTIRGFADLTQHLKQHQVAFIGSGAWATAAAKLAAENIAKPERQVLFKPHIRMWVYEEEVEGRKLSEIVNERHQNVKYLPGIQLPSSIVACSDLREAVRDASLLVVCTPHQFVYDICKQLRGQLSPSCIAISLTKGMRVRPEGPQLISEMVQRTLDINCSVLMGANIAEEVARQQLSEGTIGCSRLDHGELFRKLFESDYYLCSLVSDTVGAEMAGTLKNVVALGAGFVDGLGGGANPKATVIRCGLLEMRNLSKALYPSVQDATFLESCGAADLVASCYGGRNRRVAEAYVRSLRNGKAKTFEVLEEELLKGQKLQGVLTSNEVQQVLEMRGWQPDFPLFTVINAIVKGSIPPESIYRFREAAKQLRG